MKVEIVIHLILVRLRQSFFQHGWTQHRNFFRIYLKRLKMKTFIILVLVITATFASKYRLQSSQQHHHHNGHHKDMQCKGEPIIIPSEVLEQVEQSRKECEKIEKEKQEDGEHRRHLCGAVCIMTKIDVLNEKGFLVESKVKNLIDSAMVSQEARREMKQGIIECGKNITGLGTASSDAECSNYKPLFRCMEVTFKEVCVDPEAHEEE